MLEKKRINEKLFNSRAFIFSHNPIFIYLVYLCKYYFIYFLDKVLSHNKKTHMIILLSPAKTLDFDSPVVEKTCTEPEFSVIVKKFNLRSLKLNNQEIRDLMGISEKLAALNSQRYKSWDVNHDSDNSKQAILAFKGDVYEGLKAWEFKKKDFSFAQKHLRLLSGLYGLLRPLDLIQAHRLEMGTVYANPAGKDLYAFWGDKICNAINRDLKSI